MTHRDSRILHCSFCGAKNRVPAEKAGKPAKCGRCGRPLLADRGRSFILRCRQCRAKNRIPAEKAGRPAKCGRCGAEIPTAEAFYGEAMPVTDASFESTVLASPLPVLMFCWAPWCPSCSSVAPIIDELASTWKGRVQVCKLNVDSSPLLSSRFDLRSVPSMLIFDAGQLVDTWVGGLPRHQIMQNMASYLY